jgi:hypothetical protein
LLRWSAVISSRVRGVLRFPPRCPAPGQEPCPGAAGLGETRDQGQALVGIPGGGIGQQFESEGLKRVADKDGGRLIPLLVHRWPPATQVVVIHAGQVVMDEAVGMDAFDGGGGIERLLRGHPEQPRRFQHQEPAQAFAAVGLA